MPHLLLLEDDTDIRTGLEQHLKREGFSIAGFGTGQEALAFISQAGSGQVHKPDVALLDLTLPDMDGLDVLRAVRNDARLRTLPVILVTARNEEIDRVLGLELGADDYVTKPYSSRELTARIRAILRRAAFLEHAEDVKALAFGPIQVDTERRAVLVEGQAVELTRKEFELLEYFLRNPRRVLSRERILQQVWGLEYLGESRTIDAHVRRVRAKLGESANLIETIVGVGYRMGGPEGR